MAVTYSWDLVPSFTLGPLPDPGSYVAQVPAGRDPRKFQFERGIKFANVPGGRADFVVHGGPRVYHVNSVGNVRQLPFDTIRRDGMYSGAIKFRFRNYRNTPVPASVNKIESRSIDAFTNPVFDFTGR